MAILIAGEMMAQNPYTPPQQPSIGSADQKSVACIAMSWLTATLGILALGVSLISAYYGLGYALENGGEQLLYAISVTLLVAGCGIGLLYSSRCWKACRVRAGLLLLVICGIGFFGGPELLFALLSD